MWEVDELLQVIKAEVEAREISDAIKVREGRSSEPQSRNGRPTASALTTREHNSGGRDCVYCKGEHYSTSCEKITGVPARKEVLKKEGRCFVCLAKGHRAHQCRTFKKCHKCGSRHHQSICETENSVPNVEGAAGSQQTTTTTAARAKTKVLLQTAQSFAYSNQNHHTVPVRILFDNGSQRSYITNRLKTKLGLIPLKQETVHLNVFGSESFNKRRCDVVKLKLQGREETVEVMTLSFPSICSPLPRVVELRQCTSLQELDLADRLPQDESSHSSESTVDVLIGSDYYWDMVRGDIIRGTNGLVAVGSKFGWLISGPVKIQNRSHVTHSNLVIQGSIAIKKYTDCDCEIGNELRKFWEIESLGITEGCDEIMQDSFLTSIKYNFITGRYEVRLLWNANQPKTTNHGMCLVRLRQLMAGLKRNSSLLTEYNKILQTQIETNIIEPVPRAEWNSSNAYFLPHHGVIRDDKVTTKLRIVFDGSAKTKQSHHSISECLEKGSNLTPLIFDVLFRFRMHQIGFTADIEKAFHQIAISPDDRDMLRLLWFDNINSEEPQIIQYRFCRLVFGLTPSPAILQGIIQHHLSRYKISHPETVRLLSDTLYVDDFAGGASNTEEGFQKYQQAKRVMKEGGFNLRKWRTNDNNLQQRIDEAEELRKDSETEELQSS